MLINSITFWKYARSVPNETIFPGYNNAAAMLRIDNDPIDVFSELRKYQFLILTQM